ncbi:MAG: hypothetical protein IIZ13_00370 [Renibacterium sp.]|nr:hypothetical protein [Renibacterium sp.]
MGLTAATAFVLLPLSACSPNGVAEDRQPGIPTQLASALPTPTTSPTPGIIGQDGPLAARLPENRIGIVTWGSSSCPPTAESIKTNSDNIVEITFTPSKNNVCTADLAPTSHTLKLPDDAPKNGFTLRIRYNGAEGSTDIKVS